MALKLLIGTIVGVAASASFAAEPTAYFRDTYGVAADDAIALPEQVDSDDVVVWRTPLAKGHSSPCVVGDAIYLTTFENDRLATVALDRATGTVRWSQPAPHERIEAYHPTGSPACATPASDGRRVFSFFGSFGLLCYDTAGKLVWSVPMGPFQDEFGSGSSPIVVDGKVLLNEDHDLDSALYCFDAATGKELWRARRDGFTRSYATPIVVDAGGVRQVIVAGALQLAAYDLATGKQLWTLDGLARIVNTTPAAVGDRLYVSTWSPGGDSDARIGMEPWDVALKQWDVNKDEKLTREECNNKDVLDRFYRIDLNQDQHLDQGEWIKYARVFELARNSLMALDLTPTPAAPPRLLWKYEKGIPYVPSPLAYRDVVYLIKEGGILTSFDVRDGRVLKLGRARGTGQYYSSPVAGDGKVYLLSDAGLLTVLKGGGEWETLSSRNFNERSVATPVIADGRLYVRTEAALYCLGRR